MGGKQLAGAWRGKLYMTTVQCHHRLSEECLENEGWLVQEYTGDKINLVSIAKSDFNTIVQLVTWAYADNKLTYQIPQSAPLLTQSR